MAEEKPASTREMKINGEGLAIIKQAEGCKLQAYVCPAGKLTIGYGHTGPDVHRGLVIDQAEADRLLEADVAGAEKAVGKAVKGVGTTENQFSAMVSLAFNIGAGNFKRSSVLARHLEGEKVKAADAFLLWNKAHVGGILKVLPGLDKRRRLERALYLS